jgi:hypothetical protein
MIQNNTTYIINKYHNNSIQITEVAIEHPKLWLSARDVSTNAMKFR